MLFLTMVKIKIQTISSHEFLEKACPALDLKGGVENFAVRDNPLIKPEEI